MSDTSIGEIFDDLNNLLHPWIPPIIRKPSIGNLHNTPAEDDRWLVDADVVGIRDDTDTGRNIGLDLCGFGTEVATGRGNGIHEPRRLTAPHFRLQSDVSRAGRACIYVNGSVAEQGSQNTQSHRVRNVPCLCRAHFLPRQCSHLTLLKYAVHRLGLSTPSIGTRDDQTNPIDSTGPRPVTYHYVTVSGRSVVVVQ